VPTTPLLPLPDGLEIIAVSETPEELFVRVISTRPTSLCPECSTPSAAVHSYYRRKPLDLPCGGRRIRLLLSVRKFFCRVPTCPRKVFTERLPELLEPSSRLTSRLRTAIQAVGFAFNGKGGTRLCKQLGIQISRTTLLRSLHLVATPAVGQVRVVGIDDFAWKRGKRYGTIIVNLETHKLLDLLPDREAESVKTWLAAHPEVYIVSRDRGGAYADGAAQGAPQARQVADRWHLCKNIGDAVEAFLIRTHVRLADAASNVTELTVPAAAPSAFSTTPGRRRQSQARLLRKWKLYQQVQALHQQGTSLRTIADQLGLARNTVRTYVRQPPEEPQPTPRPLRASILDPYEDYLLQRWSQGCRNGALLYRELCVQGFTGGNSLVRAYLAYLRKHPEQATQPRRQRAAGASPRELRWLLAKKPEDLREEEPAQLSRLLETTEEVCLVYHLLQAFLQIVRERQAERLNAWMEAAQASGIKEMRSFVAGIERDYDAVRAGLSLPWSQGPVEGTVNKLKMHKRLMYGRAGFPLLRQKLLHCS
jgi:transposase